VSLRLNIRNRATQDLRLQANYILVHGSPTKASEFLEAAAATFEQLRQMPQIGRVTRLVVLRLGEVRQWRLKGLKDYLVFYRVEDDLIEILRVLHGTRDLEDILSSLDEEV
jgi:toxin ParE1/3/4